MLQKKKKHTQKSSADSGYGDSHHQGLTEKEFGALSCMTYYLSEIHVSEFIKLRHFDFLTFYYCSPITQ